MKFTITVEGGGGWNIRKNISTCGCFFCCFSGGFLDCLMHSCTIRFREQKKNFWVWGQNKNFIEKNLGKNIGPSGEKYWVDMNFIHGWGKACRGGAEFLDLFIYL